MLKRMLWVVIAAMVSGGMVFGQAYEKDKFAAAPRDWEVSAVTGYFSGGGVWKGTVTDGGAPAKATTDGGYLVGVRFGADQEYFGWEVGVMGVFENMDVTGDSADIDLPTANSADWLLGNVNALWFPFGNEIADGRVRPFLTGGPGVAYMMSDFDQIDGEMAFDMNVGLGIKFQIGEQRNPTVRIDYRWHYMTAATGELQDNLFRQEISVGLGIRF